MGIPSHMMVCFSY